MALKHPLRGVLLAPLLALAPIVPAAADVAPPSQASGSIVPAAADAAPPSKASGSVEIGTDYSSLSANYPDWNGYYLRTVWQRGERNIWAGELNRQAEFNDRGVFYSLRNTHNFSPDWFTHFSIGSSSGGFFLPRAQVNAFINKKWLRQRPLVTTLGLGYNMAKDDHRDTSFSVGATYYFPAPWIVEGGVRWNDSAPGPVLSQSQFIAITEGRNLRHYLTLRLGFGREAYQIIGPSTALANFPSHEVSLTYRRWINKEWGINVTGSYYHNPSYQRQGFTIGTFKSF